eukprot:3931818-Rhodomonas_salina.1
MLQRIRPEQERYVAILHDATHVHFAYPYCSLSSCLEGVMIPGGRAQRDVTTGCPSFKRRGASQLGR